MSIEKWFNQEHYVRYYMMTNTVLFQYLTSEKLETTC